MAPLDPPVSRSLIDFNITTSQSQPRQCDFKKLFGLIKDILDVVLSILFSFVSYVISITQRVPSSDVETLEGLQ